MIKRMLVSASQSEEIRIVVLDEVGKIENLIIELATKKSIKGNIYLGKIVRIEPSLQAAFIYFGRQKNGFLSKNQLPLYSDSIEITEDTTAIFDTFKVNQKILVQVIKEERSTKGAALTTLISLPGRFCVLVPQGGAGSIGISRKIKPQGERKRLREILNKLDIPPHMGLIVRTAGLGHSLADIRRDFKYLQRLYLDICANAQKSEPPALIHEEDNILKKAIRDMYVREIDEIIVEGTVAYRETRKLLKELFPSHIQKVKEYTDTMVPLFYKFHVDIQIEELLKPVYFLPSGGKIIINTTEALVSVDVNSSQSTSEKSIEETAYQTNLEAAYEIPRQMRLRDLSGIIVVDFIDMGAKEHWDDITKIFKQALKQDKARTNIGEINEFGLLTVTRQRTRTSISENYTRRCPCCLGYGVTRTKESMALFILRSIERFCLKGENHIITLHVNFEISEYLLNYKRKNLYDIEEKYQVRLCISPQYTSNFADYWIEGKASEHKQKERG